MRLRHPAVQRNDPGQQAKTHHARQPDIRPKRQHLRAFIQQGKIQRAVTAPHQPAGERQQQRAEATQRKPQFAGRATAGQEHAAQRHDFCHYHQRAEVTGGYGTDRRRHQQVNQQTVCFGIVMAVPVDIEQADKHAAEAKGHQPDGIQRCKLNAVVDNRHHRFCGLPARQHHSTGSQCHQAANYPANARNPAAQGFMKREDQRQNSGGSIVRYRAVNHRHRVHFAPSLSA